MPDETTRTGPMCSKCDENPGGILCPDCMATISAQGLPAAGS